MHKYLPFLSQPLDSLWIESREVEVVRVGWIPFFCSGGPTVISGSIPVLFTKSRPHYDNCSIRNPAVLGLPCFKIRHINQSIRIFTKNFKKSQHLVTLDNEVF